MTISFSISYFLGAIAATISKIAINATIPIRIFFRIFMSIEFLKNTVTECNIIKKIKKLNYIRP
jgi:hypothetical protein